MCACHCVFFPVHQIYIPMMFCTKVKQSYIPMMFCTKVKQSFSQPPEKRVKSDQLLDSAGFFSPLDRAVFLL